MCKLAIAVAAIVLCAAIGSPSYAAGPKRDAATCHKMLEGNPQYWIQGHRTRAYRPAIQRCKAGEPI